MAYNPQSLSVGESMERHGRWEKSGIGGGLLQAFSSLTEIMGTYQVLQDHLVNSKFYMLGL